MFQKKDKILGILAILLGLFVLYASGQWEGLIEGDPAGPDAAPRLLASGIIFLGMILIVGSLFYAKDKEDPGKVFFDTTIIKILLLAVVYTSLLKTIGYLILTPLFIASVMYLLFIRDIKNILFTSLISTIVLYSIFHFGLKVDLPMGILALLFV